ncbi:hypothetical protein SPW_5065 [Streptomyces sp. W007]|nr:hypothetical protein SPW_5065 [Streptomyces sp. W007]
MLVQSMAVRHVFAGGKIQVIFTVRINLQPDLRVLELLQGPGTEAVRTGDAGLELGGAAVGLVSSPLLCRLLLPFSV